MKLANLCSLPSLCRFVSCACLAGLMLAGLACAQGVRPVSTYAPEVVQSSAAASVPSRSRPPAGTLPAGTLPPWSRPAAGTYLDESLPLRSRPAAGIHFPLPDSAPAPQPQVKQLPISLDTVLRLAGEKNLQIALARERLNEACTEKSIAAMSWVPNIYLGTSYYRHEGGIQDENGRFIRSSFGALFNGLELSARFDLKEATFLKVNAERKVWQQKGELSKVTSEQLLDAANTYLDLLLARSSIAVAREMEKLQSNLLGLAQGLVKAEPGAQMLVEGLTAEILSHQQAIEKVKQQADAASVKLAYLLGLDTCVELVPVDASLVPFELVDANLSACQFVDLVLAYGPGVTELERMLAVIQSGIDKMRGPTALLPVFEMRMAEGGFGAGPGATMAWDNRWDLNLQARWNLNGLASARVQQRVVESKLMLVHLTYQDLRGKLTAGVLEAHGSIRSGRLQMARGREQIASAQKAYELSYKRLKAAGVTPNSISEVLQMIRLLELGKLTQLGAISAYDKAHLRLMILLGPAYNNQAAAPVGECRLPNP